MPGGIFDQNSKSTISLLENTQEDFRFEPNFEVGIRRTSSLDDISRFYRYFHLVQSNLGKVFTWKEYLEILQDQLKNLETLTILGKALLPLLHTQQTGESTFVSSQPSNKIENSKNSECIEALTSIETAPNTETDELPTFETEELPTTKFVSVDLCQSDEKYTSFLKENCSVSMKNKSRILRKICAETMSIAQKISKTADIISGIPHSCSECGNSLGGRRHKQSCMQRATDTGGDMAGNLEDILKPESQSTSEVPNFHVNPFQMKTFAAESPTGAGESTQNPLPVEEKTCNNKRFTLRRMVKMCKQYVTRK